MAIENRDEIGHVQSLAKRIKQIVGAIQDSFDIKKNHKILQPIKDAIDVEYVIKVVIHAEKSAYNQLIKFFDSVDYFTQDLVITLLADEESHRTIFEGYLKEYKK